MTASTRNRVEVHDYVADLTQNERGIIHHLFAHLDHAQTDSLRGQLTNCRMLLGWLTEVMEGKRDQQTVLDQAACHDLAVNHFNLAIEPQRSLYDRLLLAVVTELTKYALQGAHPAEILTAAMALIRNCAKRWRCVPAHNA